MLQRKLPFLAETAPCPFEILAETLDNNCLNSIFAMLFQCLHAGNAPRFPEHDPYSIQPVRFE
jgi:hypothetical protein